MTVRFSNQLVAEMVQPFWAAVQAGEFLTDRLSVRTVRAGPVLLSVSESCSCSGRSAFLGHVTEHWEHSDAKRVAMRLSLVLLGAGHD